MIRAIRFLRSFQTKLRTEPVPGELISIPEAQCDIQVFHPAREARSVLVFIHGIHPNGPYDPRFLAFARTCSEAGFLVLAPDISLFRNFQISPETSNQLIELVRAIPKYFHGNALNNIGLLAISFFVGGERIDATAGDLVFAPRGIPHSFLVRSDRAEYLTSFAPAGAERFFGEVAPAVIPAQPPPPPTQPDPAEFARIAAKYGIRVAQCEAPSVPLAPGQTWEVTLDAAGGLNVRKIGGRTIEQRPATTPTDEILVAIRRQPGWHQSALGCDRDILCPFLHVGIRQEIERSGLRGEIRTFGGCFNFRSKRGNNKLSVHSWAVAIDLNPETNGMGTRGNMSPEIVDIFKRFGFSWGGDWSGNSKDPMHFQFCSGY